MGEATKSATVKDPVCGMQIAPERAAASIEHNGKNYFFCGKSCAEKFRANPAIYTATETDPVRGMKVAPACSSGKHAPAVGYICPMDPEVHESGPGACPICGMALEPAQFSLKTAVVDYVCPMHPEIVLPEPQNCPICGMALEPRTISVKNANPELEDMTRRFAVAVVLTLPLVVRMIVTLLTVNNENYDTLLTSPLVEWMQLILASLVVLWCGWPFLERAWISIKTFRLNMFTLIGLGVGASYFYSIVLLFLSHRLMPGLRDEEGHLHLYFEPAAVITTLVLLGQVLELRARSRTNSALKALLNLAPKTARLVEANGDEKNIPVAAVQVGYLLRVRPGERVPVDGVVLEGTSSVDESMVSGESIPVEKIPDSQLIGGTVNGTGGLLMRAERVGSETFLSQIVRMVSEAQRTRAPIQRLADKVSSWFVPIVLLVAIATFVGWYHWGPAPHLSIALINAVAVVIIACPCALGLATPMSIMVGMGRGAQAGVLIRNAAALETFSKVKTLVVDKTGTLTEGKPRVTQIVLANAESASGSSEDEILRLIASLERSSEHPLADSVVRAAEERHLQLRAAQNFQAVPGKGASGIVDGRVVAVGNLGLMRDSNISIGDMEARANELAQQGATLLYAAIDGKLSALLAVSDPIKDSARGAIQQLHKEGLRIVMVTGDTQHTAEAVARQLGIDQVEAGVLPAQKSEAVQRLRKHGRIAMAGDGVNDAPALAQADVGIAMGSGTDVAIQTAGIVLVRGDLSGLVRARALSVATTRNIRQNLWFAFLYNTLGIPIAAGVLYPFFGILLSPVIASVAMMLSSVSVICNALRLRRMRL
jgi:Cu+-exporting ATPase